MKKLLALLAVLMLLTPAALAEDLMDGILTVSMYNEMNKLLTAEDIEYETDANYYCSYFSYEMDNPGSLGHGDMLLFAFSDGVCISGSYEDAVPADTMNEIILLCNFFNMDIYIGKFYVDNEDHYLTYELYLPMSPTDMNDFDRESFVDFTWLVMDVLEEYQEYFDEILVNGEEAAHVYAMWSADNE